MKKFIKTPAQGITLSISESSKSSCLKLIATFDPLKIFGFEQDETGWSQHLTSQHNIEALEFPDRDAQTLRKQLGTSRFVPEVYNDKSSFTESSQNLADKEETKVFTRIRTRVYQSLPICFTIWYISSVIAYASNRDVLIRNILPGQWLPTVFVEFCNKIRTSESQTASIMQTSVSNVKIPDSYKKSIFDKDFITTEEGFTFVLDFFNSLGTTPANYITGSFYDGTTAFPIPRFYSGRTTTHTSLCVTGYSGDTLSSSFVITSFSSYGENVKDVNVYDAVFLQSTLLNVDKTPYNTSTDEKFDVDGVSNTSYTLWIINRVAKGLRNSNYPKPPAPDARGFQKENSPPAKNVDNNDTPEKQLGKRFSPSQMFTDYVNNLIDDMKLSFPYPGIYVINDKNLYSNGKRIPLYVYNVA